MYLILYRKTNFSVHIGNKNITKVSGMLREGFKKNVCMRILYVYHTKVLVRGTLCEVERLLNRHLWNQLEAEFWDQCQSISIVSIVSAFTVNDRIDKSNLHWFPILLQIGFKDGDQKPSVTLPVFIEFTERVYLFKLGFCAYLINKSPKVAAVKESKNY